ncbi:MAG: hypothetical protein IJX17_04755 [Clostridia bacterium]|nr:hypothetical protein [Clostridia bacterium]
MALFKKRVIEKESNIASAPEHIKAPSTFSAKKYYLLLWNILSMTFFCIYVFYLIFRVPEISFLYNIIVYVLYGYGIALILILLLSIGKKSKLKTRLKNYKSAIKFLQYTIQIVSFTLLIVTAISSLFTTGKLDVLALKNALSSLVLTCIMVMFEVFKIMVRKNVPVVKENFLRLKEEDTIYKKIDKGFKKIRGKKTNEPEKIEHEENETETDENNEQKDSNNNLLKAELFEKQTSSQNNIEEQNKQQEIKFVSAEQIEEDLKLEKNQKYDRDAGVIISYDDDEDFDDEENYDEVFYDNKLLSRDSTKGPSRNRLVGLFNKFKKK